METFRSYGKSPCTIAVLHGGPGAPGEVKEIAIELSKNAGVIEPFQSSLTIDGQINELKLILDKNAGGSVAMIGYSWGAWLGFLFASKFSESVSKLILISSGPFEESYSLGIMQKRKSRLNGMERKELDELIAGLTLSGGSKEELFRRFGEIMEKADSFNPLEHASGDLPELKYDVYEKVWNEASALRKNGGLLEAGKNILCSVTAIHGEEDPHPWQGVFEPLRNVVPDFRGILIPNCGHKPWLEKQARDEFYRVLEEECLTPLSPSPLR